MDIIEEIRNRASEKRKHLIFPESRDPRVLHAACHMAGEELCRVTLAGDSKEVKSIASEHHIDLPATVNCVGFTEYEHAKILVDKLLEKRSHKGLTRSQAEEMLKDPLYFGAMMVQAGYADGCVAGAQATTGEVIRAAVQCIGTREGTSMVSSIFLMVMPDGRVFTYGDCGVIPYPDREQLADIAIESARTHHLLTRQEPAVAMLSFSTMGSASHERVGLVTDALEVVRRKAPDLNIDGELQFDAALVPEVARRKAAESKVAGHANVFIFPNLDAGNIAYKITERLAGATATGPILQGLAKPVMDLSRGCSWEDVVNAGCVAILMAE